MEEKRKHKRLGTRESASLLGGDGNEHHVSVHDVSLGGMRILLGSELKLGTKISGRFKILPKIGPFYVSGQVVWVKPYSGEIRGPRFEIGVQFNNVSTIPPQK